MIIDHFSDSKLLFLQLGILFFSIFLFIIQMFDQLL